ncbi:MAG TPA: four helix bundle protein [Syntrophobacteraceae bacterium]|nr:four helix bundle protein [Syntrophobacteraceae bacterium]
MPDQRDKPRDIKDRTFSFAVEIVGLCRKIEKYSDVYRTLGRQLLRSATSIGSNAEEAQSGQSRADFVSKYAISLKEARESIYWLRLIQETFSAEELGVAELIREGKEISKIIGAIIVNTKRQGSLREGENNPAKRGSKEL